MFSPGVVQRASADTLGNMLAWPQTGSRVELGHCNLGDAFTLIVDDGTSIVYVSVPAACKTKS